jgi:hypothetical protein
MARRLAAALMVLFFMNGVALADEWELGLSAGTKSVLGSIHHKSYTPNGYFRVGGSGVYVDDDPKAYKWGSIDFSVGSDIVLPGLSIDVGFRGLYGSAEDGMLDGDLGAIAFMGGMGYVFPPRVMPVPLELFGNISYAPSPLSFIDADDFLEVNLGAGVRVISNASIILSYTGYRVSMTSGPGDWTLRDDIFRVGLLLRF